MSLPDTSQFLYGMGVQCSRVALHNWVHQTELQPISTVSADQLAIDEKMIRLHATTKRSFWKFISDGRDTNVELNPLKGFEWEFLQELLEEAIRDYFVIGHKHAAERRI
jgi:hypothetical protein